MSENRPYRIIISGGGTGGHIFPAVAIANALKAELPDVEILFVGAEGKMEMEKVPQAGYKIIGLTVAGFQRGFSLSNILKNVSFPFKLAGSLLEARKIIKNFKPDVAVGVGGYASGPVLWAAQSAGIPTLIQEQNSYAGVTNKLLASKAKKICVAYDGMEKFFPKNKILMTGNPVRQDVAEANMLGLAAMFHFKLSAERKTILVIGGSLGARTINESVAAGFEKIQAAGYQLIWQTGKTYFPKAQEVTRPLPNSNGWGEAKVFDFIKEMNLAYGAADVVISRAGALSISELCLVGKTAVLVPSPNVSEDHQTQNALALVRKEAALMVTDAEAREKLIDTVLALMADESQQSKLKTNIANLGKPDAAKTIANEVIQLIK